MGIIPPHLLVDVIKNFQDKDSQIQIAGIDLTVKSIERFAIPGKISVDNRHRKLSVTEPVKLIDNYYIIPPGGYQVRYNESVHVPSDAAGLTLPRSSLMRCGATIHSALWDPGYEGKGMGLLTVFQQIKIEQNARIAQIVFFSLTDETQGQYSGVYQGEGIESE